jgi:DNA invertase Pin-like site-specific DNA recombinase
MSKKGQNPLWNKAVAYVRMSTEHQQYSTSNQLDVIKEYAKRLELEILRIISDEGKSGLNIEGREALAELIRTVREGRADFSRILVYDVSRWGRFQDPDESAFLEYICRKAGVTVHFCAEQFPNDGSLGSTMLKGMKRAMAGEYSRELSTKVFLGACRLIKLGFKQGGTAGYGLRRMLIDAKGERKGLLKMGEHKSIQTDRVILVRGPEDEVKTVCWIYNAFVHENKTEAEIASSLNGQGILTDFGRAWTRGTVHQLLTSEKYVGNNVYSRTSFKLKRQHVQNPPEEWVRADGVFEGVIEPDLFLKAREIILERSQKFTNEEMLEKLRGLLSQHGHISGILIDETEGLPSSCAFRHRFGSLVSAYRLIGYHPQIDYAFIEINRWLRKRHPEMVATVIQKIESLGAAAVWDNTTEILWVNNELRVSIVVCRHLTTSAGSSRWCIRLDAGLKPDITVAVRMNATNDGIRDYYLLPGIDMTWENLRVAESNGVYLDVYRFDSLDYFYGMAERVRLEEVI